MHCETEFRFKPWWIGLGIDIGSNKFKNRKFSNVYIEFSIICFLLGFELYWE